MACLSISPNVQVRPSSLVRLNTWEIEGRVFTLYQEGAQLKCLDRSTKLVHDLDIWENIDKTIELVQSLEPYLNRRKELRFRSLTWGNSFVGIHRIIVERGNKFFWINHTSLNEKFEICKCAIPSPDCHPESIKLIERIKHNLDDPRLLSCLQKEFICYCKGNVKDTIQDLQKQLKQKQDKIESEPEARLFEYRAPGSFDLGDRAYVERVWIDSPSIVRLKERIKRLETVTEPVCFEIEPFSRRSKIDERMFVSKFTWSVTLVAGPKDLKKWHASILIEGLSDGWFRTLPQDIPTGKGKKYAEKLFTHLNSLQDRDYFMHRLHLMGDNNIWYENAWPSENGAQLYDSRSLVYMVSSSKVKDVISKIFLQLWGRADISFCRLGADSMFNSKNAHNCFTWARERLKELTINIGKAPLDNIAALVTCYTKLDRYYKTLDVVPEV